MYIVVFKNSTNKTNCALGPASLPWKHFYLLQVVPGRL